MRRRRAERVFEYERPGFRELTARLASNVRLLREERAWTQEEAAERARMATPLLQRVEAGATNATLITVAKLCDGFEVDVRRLFAPVLKGAARRVPRSTAHPAALHETPPSPYSPPSRKKR